MLTFQDKEAVTYICLNLICQACLIHDLDNAFGRALNDHQTKAAVKFSLTSCSSLIKGPVRKSETAIASRNPIMLLPPTAFCTLQA
jgi:hypothetical protein